MKIKAVIKRRTESHKGKEEISLQRRKQNPSTRVSSLAFFFFFTEALWIGITQGTVPGKQREEERQQGTEGGRGALTYFEWEFLFSIREEKRGNEKKNKMMAPPEHLKQAVILAQEDPESYTGLCLTASL